MTIFSEFIKDLNEIKEDCSDSRINRFLFSLMIFGMVMFGYLIAIVYYHIASFASQNWDNFEQYGPFPLLIAIAWFVVPYFLIHEFLVGWNDEP